MATVWITYAWEDNKEGDIDFAAQELQRSGLQVKLDRWNLQAGKRLWEQIEKFITNEDECNGWVLYATQNSLGSEPCKEEYAYALDRALRVRGNDFPVIGLFPTTVDTELIPAEIRTRLYVNLTDPDWKERIKAAAEGRSAVISRPTIDPYSVHIHENAGGRRFVIEVRPRAGSWSPFIAGIPHGEKDVVNPRIMHGPKVRVPMSVSLFGTGMGESDDKAWWFMFAQNEATPTQSYFISCDKLPTKLLFGVNGGSPQYLVEFAR